MGQTTTGGLMFSAKTHYNVWKPGKPKAEKAVIKQGTLDHGWTGTVWSARGKVVRPSVRVRSNGKAKYRLGLLNVNPFTLLKYRNFADGTDGTGRNLVWNQVTGEFYELVADRSLAAVVTPMYVHPDTALDAWLLASAAQDVQQQAREPSFDAGTTLGELPETIAQLRDPFKGIRNQLSNLRKKVLTRRKKRSRKRSRKGSVTDDVASTWLEYRYGVLPLALTIDDAVKTAMQAARQIEVYRSKKSASPVVTYSKGVTTVGAWYVYWEKKVETTQYACCGMVVECGHNRGVDLRSLPSVAWELTTLSFVADWFVGIGAALSSLRGINGRTISSWNTQVKRTKVTVKVTDVKAINGQVLEDTLTGCTAVAERAYIVRGLGVPLISFPLQGKWLNLRRALDSVALTSKSISKLIKSIT